MVMNLHVQHVIDTFSVMLTVDKPTRGQSSRRLVNSQTSQFANSEFF